eukprot:TRINITY_DN30608_c0_g1_i1.p1 TRINITY_DN30608_c0_g1~~TRINITY_DN30608_c0_g1_i1.p1  ORF type:complete len:807 (+),score=346.30 TRINITY_DN30608_c0_g1_i1:88-2508(+)
MGKKTEVKPGLMLEEKGVGKETEIIFHNQLRDRMYKCTYGFKGGSVVKVGDTVEKDGKYTVNVYPGESARFVRGTWTGMSKSHGSGEPDKAWKEKQSAEAKGEAEKDVKYVKELLQKKGLAKVTAPAVAECCAEAGVKFVDLTFPPRDSSMKPAWIKRNIQMYPWKRPTTYLKGTGLSPTLFVDRIEPGDIDQGALADCYLMGALASVAEFEWLVRSLFDDGQDVELGCYKVSLCKNGWWQTVLVDDFLPCSGSKPAFSRNREEVNELWVCLVEKAYAKLHGSFAAIQTGACKSALTDLTGCPSDLTELQADMWPTLLGNDKKEFLQVLGTPGRNLMGIPDDQVSKEERTLWDKYQTVGLICEHCYSLITVVETKKDKHKLCLIRNPWGNEKEWNGKWSDSDTKSWTAELKKECGYVNDATDGSFWMEWGDVQKWFNNVAICYTHGTWDQVHVAGNFNKGVSDIMIKVQVKKELRCWFAVHQKDPRGVEPGHQDAKLDHLGMYILEGAPDAPGGPVKCPASRSLNSRDIYKEMKLSPGKAYYLVAQPKDQALTKSIVYTLLVEDCHMFEITFHTPAPGKNHWMEKPAKDFIPDSYTPTKANYQIKGQFTTNGSVLTKVGTHATFKEAKKEMNQKTLTEAANRAAQNTQRKAGKAVKVEGSSNAPLQADSVKINVRVIKGKGLVSMDSNGLSDPFCELKLREVKEGKVQPSHPNPQKKVTKVIPETLDPVWDEQFTFLVPGSDCLRVSIFDKDIVGKDNMGRVDLVMPNLIPKLAKDKEYVSSYTVKPIKAKDTVSGTVDIGVTLLQ